MDRLFQVRPFDPIVTEDLGALIQADPRHLRCMGIVGASFGYLSLRLIVRTQSFTWTGGGIAGASKISEIKCYNAVDYSIRAPDPGLIEGGPFVEYHERHPLLNADHLQGVPGGDGEVFDPPLKLTVLVLDRSYVIAERFEIGEYIRKDPR